MPRYKMTIEYDGRPYAGWQRQADAPSVQQAIEEAIEKISNGKQVRLFGSGRTDAGVHALGQVAHVDIDRDMDGEKFRGAVNYHLGQAPISILHAEQVSAEFHARFDAVKRHYTYRIRNRIAPLTFEKGLVWHVKEQLNADMMHEAAQLLVGQHDFTTFRHVNCQAKSPVKTVDYLNVERRGEEILIHAGARSFLHHQIRSFTGTLKLVGAGQWTPDDVQAALEARDRTALGFNAPPDGLYFTRIEFE
ncbi:tRNA pseudouridine synthase A [Kordiimonas sediminis]|uniref:tRNA pseudouridine synthase A n=1 Tax=Kordiimonas sediminis TaxID=1735581 RepID=A0A919AMF9_9PROT|nr:tRNA pseudouridine(38-40) synthase TruA [Kordiimonas sediminis]GHF15926.1 tRNA pseudouridine synthase A [Kordiimonas sediminis]